jgi:hypothetical protein
MSLIEHLFRSLRNALTTDTMAEVENRFLSEATDHADLERRIAIQSRAHVMTPLNIGR